ncbi:MAG TPA: MerR family transcriptional regulator [Actinomycetota bacterium]|jgi:DNA-binding transcriptional MerR regulator|nr:MerR family transcriptional regulator [Actinomycetota bacterium]HRY09485.1 MerR family transcriptional regulator [Candidatus Nanopelagicales bacterium]HUM86482.1 MerR family transcriptional regulator [Actinomycetota bacterium]
MFTVKHAAEHVGITAATLRAWERRYGVTDPSRTDSGYRVYDEHDVAVLRAMKQLVDAGWQPSLAARQARDQIVAASPVTEQPEPSLASSLVRAAEQLDTSELSTALDRVFALHGFETVMDQHLFPALRALGDAWADGRVSVAGEHLASHAVMRRLAVAYETTARGRGPAVLLGMAPGCRHELGLFAFAVAARRQGMNTDYLGADVPLADWSTALQRRTYDAVVIAMPTHADVGAATSVVEAIGHHDPHLLVAVGGGEQYQAPASAIRLGHDLLVGVAQLNTAIRSR